MKDGLTSLKNKNVVIIGSYLALMALSYLDSAKVRVITSQEHDITLPPDTVVVHNDVSKKANLTINVLLNSLERNFELEHDMKVM